LSFPKFFRTLKLFWIRAIDFLARPARCRSLTALAGDLVVGVRGRETGD
jgi:hypothetical protein